VIGIVGSGIMGRGIGEVFQSNGFEVLWYDSNPILSSVTNISDLFDCELIVEAATESIDIKKSIFKSLSLYENILCTNTSALSIEDLSNFVPNKENFLGLHFMNPPKKIHHVEVIPCTKTICTDKITKYIDKIKYSWYIVPDRAGFVLNRVLFGMINEAMMLVDYGVDIKTIDDMMQNIAQHKVGPLALSDYIGLDTCNSIIKSIYGKTPKCLEILLSLQKKGKKSGEGFYKYDNKK
jgi:3-hydroxybutyryl-CoA dehydrogenase